MTLVSDNKVKTTLSKNLDNTVNSQHEQKLAKLKLNRNLWQELLQNSLLRQQMFALIYLAFGQKRS